MTQVFKPIKKFLPASVFDYDWQIDVPVLVVSTPITVFADNRKEIFKNDQLTLTGETYEWDGLYDPLANTLESSARDQFIAADMAYHRITGKHIDINEGETAEGNARRSCRRQAELWMRYNVLQIPGSAKANKPGCSHHNYGLAADLKNSNDKMREILAENGWTDDIPGEAWHFTCTGSEQFSVVQKKIAELQTTKALQWADDSAIAFKLNKERTATYNALKVRQTKFETNVHAFNSQAKKFNDAKLKFHQQTEPYAIRRDELSARMEKVDLLTKQLEDLFQHFRTLSDELVNAYTDNIVEIRRLMLLAPDELAALNLSALPKIPKSLRDSYNASYTKFKSTKDLLERETVHFSNLLQNYESSLNSFELQAVELLKERDYLARTRSTLEEEKNSLERGFTDVQLMSQEAMFRLVRSSQTVEEIQEIVNSVSA